MALSWYAVTIPDGVPGYWELEHLADADLEALSHQALLWIAVGLDLQAAEVEGTCREIGAEVAALEGCLPGLRRGWKRGESCAVLRLHRMATTNLTHMQQLLQTIDTQRRRIADRLRVLALLRAAAIPAPETPPQDPWGHGRSLLEVCEARTDADVQALTCERLKFDLEILVENLVEEAERSRGAESDLRAARRLFRVAERHEDVEVLAAVHKELDWLVRTVPAYAHARQRLVAQWSRHWEALFKHRLPDEIYEALLDMAERQGCTLAALMAQILGAAVAEWHAQRTQA